MEIRAWRILWPKGASKNLVFTIKILLLVVLVQAGVLISGRVPTATSFGSKQSLEAYAKAVVELCKDASYRPTCYEEEVPKLMDVISMEEVFVVTALVQDMDPGFPYCHVLGHELSAREVRKNPEDWKEVATRCPSGTCSNGCLHGGFQERFRVESVSPEELGKVKEEIFDLCEPRKNWNPTGLEQGSCYHALGHLAMYITDANIPLALETCDEIIERNGKYEGTTQLCYDGVFMQVFQPLEPDDFDLVEGLAPLSKEEVAPFCARYSGRYQDRVTGSCLSESWPLYFNDLLKPEGLVTFCGATPESVRDRCFNAMFYVLAAQFGLDESRIGEYCAGMPGDLRGMCFANAASRMIEVDYRFVKRAVDMCGGIAKEVGEEGACFSELVQYSTYNYRLGSSEFFEFCSSLPSPWQEQCLLKAP